MGLETFGKAERLCSKKLIKELFNRGSSFYIYPFKVIHLPCPGGGDTPTQILISVPKRNFKKAVDRNKIKRRIKEAYRLNKQHFPSIADKPLTIAYIYTAKESLDYQSIQEKLKGTLQRLSNETSVN
jgi:ribonuclease P protein component